MHLLNPVTLPYRRLIHARDSNVSVVIVVVATEAVVAVEVPCVVGVVPTTTPSVATLTDSLKHTLNESGVPFNLVSVSADWIACTLTLYATSPLAYA